MAGEGWHPHSVAQAFPSDAFPGVEAAGAAAFPSAPSAYPLAYQPPPESTKAVRETSRDMPAGVEQEGQSCTSGALTDWIRSSLAPQLAQAYS